MHTFWNINKTSTRPHSTMQSRKFMIFWSNQGHKILLHHRSPLLRLQSLFKTHVHHTLLCNFFLNIMINKFRIILSTNTSQRFPFRLRNSQFFKSFFYIIRNIFPFTAHLSFRTNISRNILNIKPFNSRSPVRHSQTVIHFKRFQTKFLHPLRIPFFLADFCHNISSQPTFNSKKILLIFFVAKIVKFSIYIINKSFILSHRFFHKKLIKNHQNRFPKNFKFKTTISIIIFIIRAALLRKTGFSGFHSFATLRNWLRQPLQSLPHFKHKKSISSLKTAQNLLH